MTHNIGDRHTVKGVLDTIYAMPFTMDLEIYHDTSVERDMIQLTLYKYDPASSEFVRRGYFGDYELHQESLARRHTEDVLFRGTSSFMNQLWQEVPENWGEQ